MKRLELAEIMPDLSITAGSRMAGGTPKSCLIPFRNVLCTGQIVKDWAIESWAKYLGPKKGVRPCLGGRRSPVVIRSTATSHAVMHAVLSMQICSPTNAPENHCISSSCTTSVFSQTANYISLPSSRSSKTVPCLIPHILSKQFFSLVYI